MVMDLAYNLRDWGAPFRTAPDLRLSGAAGGRFRDWAIGSLPTPTPP